jgi:hypothetical protein
MVSEERGIHLMCVCVLKEEYKYRYLDVFSPSSHFDCVLPKLVLPLRMVWWPLVFLPVLEKPPYDFFITVQLYLPKP